MAKQMHFFIAGLPRNWFTLHFSSEWAHLQLHSAEKGPLGNQQPLFGE